MSYFSGFLGMEEKKSTNQFSQIEETMLFTLYGRALYSMNPDNGYKDEEAEQLLMLIDVNLEELKKEFGVVNQIGCAARASTIEVIIKEYIQSNPQATIVNIGAGLDNTFNRVDNGSITWYNLDLPEAVRFRKKFLLDSDRNITIAKSVFDYSWIEDIKFDLKKGIFLFAVGVFPYFTHFQIEEIFRIFPEKFPRGEIIFDAVSKRGMNLINKKIRKKKKRGEKTDIEMLSYINKPEDLLKITNKVQIIGDFPFYAKIPHIAKWKLKVKAVNFFNSKFKLSKFLHLRFKS